uniref:Uncharacterized protein n=1 Tax=Timema cristinae TaxID=61476 RepID=A0A7R9CF70_TIMCR|nr:unnamed protein product [Timema cristinae]
MPENCVRTDIDKGKVVSRCCNLGIKVISLQFKDIHHAGFTHSSSKDNPAKPILAAISDKGTALGTTSATVYCLVGSPYTQMFSTTGQVFISVSTLPRDTYSPSCNFTKSFLRSTRRNIVSSKFYNHLLTATIHSSRVSAKITMFIPGSCPSTLRPRPKLAASCSTSAKVFQRYEYSSPMTSLVLTDSGLLTQHLVYRKPVKLPTVPGPVTEGHLPPFPLSDRRETSVGPLTARGDTVLKSYQHHVLISSTIWKQEGNSRIYSPTSPGLAVETARDALTWQAHVMSTSADKSGPPREEDDVFIRPASR